MGRGNAEAHLDSLHVMASAAKQSILLCGSMDCFAALAMTMHGLFEI
jgi:hypothetical protein